MAHGIYEGMWLKRLLNELKIPSITKNLVHHDQTKHVEIDRHFIKEKIEEGAISLDYTPTTLQTADILTKTLF